MQMKKSTPILKVLFMTLLLGLSLHAGAQEIKWFNPQKSDIPCIQQRGWTEEMGNSYNRMPERMKGKVRDAVYSLSRNSAGLAIHFYSNAPEIYVRFKVVGGLSMMHMPATGVSGIDLYSIDQHGEWDYRIPRYKFGKWVEGETHDGIKEPSGTQVEYSYHKLPTDTESEYRIYFPLYNVVSEMEIGVAEGSIFKVAEPAHEKPIIVFGTSVTQGGCASRPGNAWTNMVSRRLDLPVINLGFSGNGMLDPEVIDLMNEIDAAVFVLDCNGNLNLKTPEEIVSLTISSVEKIRAVHPKTPILISDMPGYSYEKYGHGVNDCTRKAYDQIKDKVNDLYYLSCADQGEPLDGKVDGIHPNDLGMYFIANAFEAKFREILHMPLGKLSTQIPVTQRRDIYFYGWMERHQEILAGIRAKSPKNVLMGDSITHYWGGFEKRESGKESWYKYLAPLDYRNMGYGWDRVENLLWRVYHGELDGFSAENIVVNIGTNNISINSDEEIAEGILFLLNEIRYRQPEARIKFMAIYPRRGAEERVRSLNQAIEAKISPAGYEFVDCGKKLVHKNGKIIDELFVDGLHPNEKGYKKIVKSVLN